MDTHIRLQFLGGVSDGSNLTGSATVLTIRRKKQITRILIDAGLVQCDMRHFFERNNQILNHIDPKTIDHVVLTHGHTDHIGRLPHLVRHGFGSRSRSSRIFCTPQTASLLEVMFEDSAKIQSEMVNILRKISNSNTKLLKNRDRSQCYLGSYDRKKQKIKHNTKRGVEPLFSTEDIPKTLEMVKGEGCAYNEWIKISKYIFVKFYPAGHVLGSAVCVFRIESEFDTKYIGFSGDLGRKDGIILPPPENIKEPLDFLCIESTYGNKSHPERDSEIQKLLQVVKTAQEKKEKILIPSFALERAQEIIYLLSYYIQEGKIDPINIYLDSPMAQKITDIFAHAWNKKMFLDQDRLEFNPFDRENNPYFHIISDWEESRTFIHTEKGPYIVIAGSGMCDHGRIRSHLKHNLESNKAHICLIGYMGDKTLGRRLKDKWPVIKMNGQEIKVNAHIHSFESFSAHADKDFLLEYIIASTCDEKTPKIFINHGEREGAEELKKQILRFFDFHYDDITIPSLNEEFILA